MMTLAQASSYFDRTRFLDAYSGAPLFLGQIDPYDDSKRDAMAAYRRILSVAPGITIPAHRAIYAQGVNWLVAKDPEIDGLEEQHRAKYVLQRAEGQFKIGTISQFLDNAPAMTVFAFPSWVKDSKEIGEDSKSVNLYEVMLASSVDVAPQSVIWRDGEAYLALTERGFASGFTGTNALRLDQVEPLDATITERAFSPALGKNVATGTSYPLALRVRWQSLFDYAGQLDARYQEGDFVLAFPDETEVNTSSRVEFEEKQHQVLAVTVFPGCVAAHVREI